VFASSDTMTCFECGQNAYHSLPQDWIGCCYPALLDVGTSIYRTDGKQQLNDNHKEKRAVSKSMPMMYQGTKLWDPWTSRVAMTGWSLLPGGGTAASLLKINGLAWQVLKLANETEDALNLLNEELHGIREAVIQNRLVLDMITAEKGGVCKMLGTSCCFNLPDVHKNVTDIIQHMKETIATPHNMGNFLDEWFMGLEGWSRWLISVVAPVLGIGLIILTAIPCVVSCTKSLVSRIATNRLMEIDLGGEYVTMTICRTCNNPMDVENYVDEILEGVEVNAHEFD